MAEDDGANTILSDLEQVLSKEELERRKSRMSASSEGGAEESGKFKRQLSKQISRISTTAVSEEDVFDDGAATDSPTRRRRYESQVSKESQASVSTSKMRTASMSASQEPKTGKPEPGTGNGPKDKLIEAEGTETGSVKLSVLVFYMRSVGLVMATGVLLAQLLGQGK